MLQICNYIANQTVILIIFLLYEYTVWIAAEWNQHLCPVLGCASAYRIVNTVQA